jgi:hypothetical protein
MADEKDIIAQDKQAQEEYIPQGQAQELVDALNGEKSTFPYVTASSCNPVGAVVPTKLAYETYDALKVFFDQDIDTAEFVKEKLQYTSRLAVCEAFAAEQCDAIALAILQMERNKGFIVGDMAGIGKGRICAGLLRYAALQGKIPVFITYKPNLFSDMYRDFYDIGGYAPKQFYPNPFVFNVGKEANIKEPYLQYFEEDESGEEKMLFKSKTNKEVIEMASKKRMPDGYDIVMLTYSQISFNPLKKLATDNAYTKYSFLESIADNAIFVLDESHKAAGESNMGNNVKSLLANAYGCMFASATYAKTPKAMSLYINKTDINDSAIRPAIIEKAIVKNGEVVQEYIAGALVQSGQMIRRERTYDGIDISYLYEDSQKEIEKYYDIYDRTIELYNEISAFASSSLCRDAVKNVILKTADDYSIDIWDAKTDPMPDKKKKPTEYDSWVQRNKKKFSYAINNDRLLKNRFQWIENLLFSIKAEYVADKVLETMSEKAKKPVKFKVKGQEYVKEVNYKPVIAMRGTAESSMRELGYYAGQVLTKEENDFSRTLINILKSLTVTKITFNPVVEGKQAIVVDNVLIKDSDFGDGGVRYNEIVVKVKNSVSGIPISPIDHIKNKIESTKRPDSQMEFSSTLFYKVEEITKRKLQIKKIDDKFEVINSPTKSVTEKVDSFNNGSSDVIMLNTSGSTGLSIHSSEKFFDKRPRKMFIHQVELDVNEEVQKRGRINRTGQVNLPAYAYIVSPIPSEIRKLMMLRQKLRSLDANTTGNVKQSAKSSEIKDSSGNEIEDIYNKYGYQVLLEMLEMPEYNKFKAAVPQYEDWIDNDKDDSDKIDDFARELEKFKSKEQLEFYNGINEMYIQRKKELIEKDEFDIDTNIQDLKASTRNKRVVYFGDDTNLFTKSVFIEDKYITPKLKPLTKEQLMNKIVKIAGKENYNERHSELISEFQEYGVQRMQKISDDFGEPDYKDATTEQEKEKIRQKHEAKLEELLTKEKARLDYIQDNLIYFLPNRPYYIPENMEDVSTDWSDRASTIKRKSGKFLGFKIGTKSDNKFTGMNIEMVFAGLTKLNPYFTLTLTKANENAILWLRTSPIVSAIEAQIINEWVIKDSGERSNMRVLTGEIFQAFNLSDNLIDNDKNYYGVPKLIKYTNADGTVESGVVLKQLDTKYLPQEKQTSYVPLNSPLVIEGLQQPFFEGRWKLMPNLQDRMMFNQTNNFYYISISTGYRYAKKNAVKGLLSKWSNPASLQTIAGITKVVNQQTYATLIDPLTGKSYRNCITQDFKNITRDDFQLFLDYIYGLDKESFGIDGGDYIIRESKDVDLKSGKDDDDESGIFTYYPTSKFEDSNKPPYFVSWSTTPQNIYGVVVLSKIMSPLAALSYGYIPVEIEKGAAVRNFMTLFSDEKNKQDFIYEVQMLGDNYIKIGKLAVQQTSIPIKFSFGDVDLYTAGEILAEYAQDPSKYIEEKVEKKEREEMPKVPLTYESAQDFLIRIKSI